MYLSKCITGIWGSTDIPHDKLFEITCIDKTEEYKNNQQHWKSIIVHAEHYWRTELNLKLWHTLLTLLTLF